MAVGCEHPEKLADAEDALAILTARSLNPEVRIVAAANQTENINKLKRAGANTVISPATIGGKLLVRSALGEGGTEAVADDLELEGVPEPLRDASDAALWARLPLQAVLVAWAWWYTGSSDSPESSDPT